MTQRLVSCEVKDESHNSDHLSIVTTLLLDVRIMQSKSYRYGDERTLIVRSYMGERTVYYIGARMSRARPNQALVCATE